MIIKNLYKYIREDGGITVSPIKPDCEYTESFRLIADENKCVTIDGEALFSCIDVETAEGWYEVDAPAEAEDTKALRETKSSASE